MECESYNGNPEVRPSGKHGLGVYATTSIRKGDPIVDCRGTLKEGHELREDERALQVGETTYLAEDPNQPSFDNYFNHSCTPNMGFIEGTLTLFALRDIAAGEELTWDYSTSMTEPGWEISCRCGTSQCRKSVGGFFACSAEDQARLLPRTLNYIREKYAALHQGQ